MNADHNTTKRSSSITPTERTETQGLARLGLADFQFDNEYKVITRCPAGHLSLNRVSTGRYITASFNADECRACRQLYQCPTIFKNDDVYDDVVVIKFKREWIAAYKRDVLGKESKKRRGSEIELN